MPAVPPSLIPPRRCRACGYILDHLAQPRCPECGRPFNPDDQDTLRRDDSATRSRGDLQTTALGAVTAMLVVTAPWAALTQLRLAAPLTCAAAAGLAAALFAAAWAHLLPARPFWWTVAAALPAALLIAVEELRSGRWHAAAAILLGLSLAGLLNHAARASRG